jgi:hypothetical protein
VAAAALAAIGLTAAAAHADVNPTDPYAACGVGFALVRREAVVRTGEPAPAATFYLLYNPAIDTFCGVTSKDKYIGVDTETMAGVGGASGTVLTSSGRRLYFAGPVWERPGLGSTGRCVAYGASLTDAVGNTYHHESANPAIGWSLYCPS